MKMVRSLLLGSAAGLVAVTAGQAADLPVKARPVQYVKICSLYGAGFYYMPGTDMCLKIGGWARAEVTWGINGSSTTGVFGNSVYNNRYTNNLWTRERGYITADAREQTAYGVARGYIAVGISSNNTGAEAPSSLFSSNRAYVQWAGFTAGLAVSFYDFYPAAAYLYRAGNIPQEDTGDGGWWVWGYTAQLGGGVSATFAAEERRSGQIYNTNFTSGAAFGIGTNGSLTASVGTGGYGGWQNPDYVGNLRVDQAWGSAQVMAAAHQLNTGYYGTTPITGGPSSTTWGWVVGGGIKVNLPSIAPGDNVITQVSYTQGALKYLWNSNSGSQNAISGGTEGYGVGVDCVYGGVVGLTGTGCQQTTAWEVLGAFEHYWTPQWHQSLAGSYYAVSYSSLANNMLCDNELVGGNPLGNLSVPIPGCNNNWSFWGVGSRLQWDVTKSFYVGVEAIYQHLNSAQFLAGVTPPGTSLAFGGGPFLPISDQSNWTFTVRMHKDFLP